MNFEKFLEEVVMQTSDDMYIQGKSWMAQRLSEERSVGIEEGLKQGVEQGIERGLEKGLEKGLEQGIEHGLKKGLQKGKQEIIKKMLLNNISPQDIIGYTGITATEFATLHQRIKNSEKV